MFEIAFFRGLSTLYQRYELKIHLLSLTIWSFVVVQLQFSIYICILQSNKKRVNNRRMSS